LIVNHTTSAGEDARPPLLEFRGVAKSFGGVKAVRNADLQVAEGEIHALLGENGAGKSTLVKILAGAHQRDAGDIVWGGRPTEISSLGDADAMGIRVIYQHLNVVDHLTVEENLSLGREPRRFGLVRRGESRRRARAALAALGVDLDLDRQAAGLRVAEKQLIEIARALASGETRLLVMDEPTASLGDREVERLFEVVRALRDRGMAIIYISHKLEEILGLVDRITILRDGQTIETLRAAETTQDQLITRMVGRELGHQIKRRSRPIDRVVLEAEDLWTETGLKGVSLQLRAGEVLGVYGLLGSGRTELARALFGADPVQSGTVRINGEPVSLRSPIDAIRNGVGLVPEERAQALFPLLSIRENLTAASADRVFSRGLLQRATERALARGVVGDLSIRTPSEEQLVGRLSGGNQQKVVVGRWLLRQVPILIMDDPTVGVDVGAKDELYRLIGDMTESGTSVLLSSSELPELLLLADRLAVLHDGRLVGVLEGDDLTQQNVLELALGHGRGADQAEPVGDVR
jgi:ribose transport system ATP-binding protein